MEKNTAKYTKIVSTGSIALLLLAACGESKEVVVDDGDKSVTEDEMGSTEKSSPDLETVENITSTQEWQRFKKNWKNLSSIDPKLDSTNTWSLFHVYNNTLSDNAKTKMRGELDSCKVALNKLHANGILDEGSLQVLENIAEERFKYITEGYGYMFMTRMAPAPGTYDRVYLVEDLEARIDTLQQLKDKGLITDSLQQRAIGKIQKDIESFALTNFESGYHGHYTSPVIKEEDSDSSFFQSYYSRLEENHNKRIANMKKNKRPSKEIETVEKNYERSLKSIRNIEKGLPTLKLLIEDLEK